MKKQYIKPISDRFNASSCAILAGSEVPYSGTNKGTGIITAESKLFDIIEDDNFSDDE